MRERGSVHPDREAAAIIVPADPGFDLVVNLPPATHVEITDREIGGRGKVKGLLQGGEKRLVDVVKDSGHLGLLAEAGTVAVIDR
jgi:hypothetical protein